MAWSQVLFICWGNICRSPTAEGIMRQLVKDAGLAGQIEVDSAGVSAEHAGQPPDLRTVAEAARRGIDLRSQRARKVRARDWEHFDLLLVADDLVEQTLRRQAPRGASLDKVVPITRFLDDRWNAHEVPDPYYGGQNGFREVFELLEAACSGLLEHLRTAVP